MDTGWNTIPYPTNDEETAQNYARCEWFLPPLNFTSEWLTLGLLPCACLCLFQHFTGVLQWNDFCAHDTTASFLLSFPQLGLLKQYIPNINISEWNHEKPTEANQSHEKPTHASKSQKPTPPKATESRRPPKANRKLAHHKRWNNIQKRTETSLKTMNSVNCNRCTIAADVKR